MEIDTHCHLTQAITLDTLKSVARKIVRDARVNSPENPSIITLIENDLMHRHESDPLYVCLLPVPVDDWDRGMCIPSYYNADEKTIYMREDVYVQACNGNSSALTTLAHELAHHYLFVMYGLPVEYDTRCVFPYVLDSFQHIPDLQAEIVATFVVFPDEVLIQKVLQAVTTGTSDIFGESMGGVCVQILLLRLGVLVSSFVTEKIFSPVAEEVLAYA